MLISYTGDRTFEYSNPFLQKISTNAIESVDSTIFRVSFSGELRL